MLKTGGWTFCGKTVIFSIMEKKTKKWSEMSVFMEFFSIISDVSRNFLRIVDHICQKKNCPVLWIFKIRTHNDLEYLSASGKIVLSVTARLLFQKISSMLGYHKSQIAKSPVFYENPDFFHNGQKGPKVVQKISFYMHLVFLSNCSCVVFWRFPKMEKMRPKWPKVSVYLEI